MHEGWVCGIGDFEIGGVVGDDKSCALLYQVALYVLRTYGQYNWNQAKVFNQR